VARWDASDVDELRRQDLLLRLDTLVYSALLHDGGSEDEIARVRQCLRGHVTAMRRCAAAASRVTLPAGWRA
jgi:hypothetical protein